MAEGIRNEWESLLRDYCQRIDLRDFEGLAEVVTSDCEIHYGDVSLRGLSALRDYLEGQFERFAATRHDLGSVEAVDLGVGVHATLARIEAWHRFHPREGKRRPDLTIFGRFESRFVETSSGWRIAVHRGSEDERLDEDTEKESE